MPISSMTTMTDAAIPPLLSDLSEGHGKEGEDSQWSQRESPKLLYGTLFSAVLLSSHFSLFVEHVTMSKMAAL